jgi:signal transduction histidine kinase
VTLSEEGTVVVEDQGPGIPDKQKEAIFTRFWRADPIRGGGAGIGLALVKRIVELHGGSVRVEDRACGGSRFVLASDRRISDLVPLDSSAAVLLASLDCEL